MASLYYYMSYNGVYAENKYATLATIPVIESAEYKDDDRYSVPGKDGELVMIPQYRSKGNAHVRLTLQLKDKWLGYSGSRNLDDGFKTLRKWLTGNGTLKIWNYKSGIDGNYLMYEFEVIQITMQEIRKDNEYGRLEVDFEVFPVGFINGHDVSISGGSGFTLMNYGDIGYPVYSIKSTSSGSGTLTVNGLTMGYTLVADEWLNIDTRRMIAYTGNTNKSSSVNGDYKNLLLNSGANIISVSSGHIFNMVPHWGFRL